MSSRSLALNSSKKRLERVLKSCRWASELKLNSRSMNGKAPVMDGDSDGDLVGFEVVGETEGETVGTEVVGDVVGLWVGDLVHPEQV